VSRSPTVAMSSETETIVMADCSALTFVQTAAGMMDIAYANAPSGTYGEGDVGNEQYERHSGGSNVVFADCHVRGYTPQRLFGEVPPLE